MSCAVCRGEERLASRKWGRRQTPPKSEIRRSKSEGFEIRIPCVRQSQRSKNIGAREREDLNRTRLFPLRSFAATIRVSVFGLPSDFGLRNSDFPPRVAGPGLLHAIDQRGESLNPNLEPITRLNRPHTAGRAGENDVAGQQSHVGRNKTDQPEAIED